MDGSVRPQQRTGRKHLAQTFSLNGMQRLKYPRQEKRIQTGCRQKNTEAKKKSDRNYTSSKSECDLKKKESERRFFEVKYMKEECCMCTTLSI